MTGPLGGLRVLVPRTDGNDASLRRLLAESGAVAVSVPLIAVAPPADRRPLEQAVAALAEGTYDWIGFASANAVRAVAAAADADRLRVPATTRVATVGPATAMAARAAGLRVDLEPARSAGAAELLAAWPPPPVDGAAVLLPSSAIGSPELADGLVGLGYRVDRVDAYTTVAVAIPPDALAELRGGSLAAVLLTSGSTARSLAAQATLHPGVFVGCIGPGTAAAARAAGLPVGFVADEATAAGLVAGLARALADPPTGTLTSPPAYVPGTRTHGDH